MAKSKNLTEQEILDVAEKLFLEKGYNGTSTVEIAKEAGCNQALIHYYYRTKELLFLTVFTKKVALSFTNFSRPFSEDKDFFTKIRDIVNAYFDFLSENERLPFFIISELTNNEKLNQKVKDMFTSDKELIRIFSEFDRSIRAEVAKGSIRKVEPFNLVMDIVCLCLSAFIAMPIVKRVAQDNEEVMNAYLDMRRTEISEVIISGIKA